MSARTGLRQVDEILDISFLSVCRHHTTGSNGRTVIVNVNMDFAAQNQIITVDQRIDRLRNASLHCNQAFQYGLAVSSSEFHVPLYEPTPSLSRIISCQNTLRFEASTYHLYETVHCKVPRRCIENNSGFEAQRLSITVTEPTLLRGEPKPQCPAPKTIALSCTTVGKKLPLFDTKFPAEMTNTSNQLSHTTAPSAQQSWKCSICIQQTIRPMPDNSSAASGKVTQNGAQHQ